MYLSLPALLLPFLTTAYIIPATFPLRESTAETELGFRIPTIHESAIQARRILHLESIGTLSTIFPSTSLLFSSVSSLQAPLESRSRDLRGLPIGLMDYMADCEPDTGNPTILALDIATSFKNVAAGSNITLSLRWHPPPTWRGGAGYSAAALPRFSLVGYLEPLTEAEVKEQEIAKCFTGYHPDAVAWLPGNRIHTSRWVRLVVEEVYWIGGFGDRAYIGWISTDEWKNVTKQEVESIRLPGETSGFWWW